ncbi:MAG: hypothetical protein ACREBG_15245 [Pyrinomonadaceae bacterium]
MIPHRSLSRGNAGNGVSCRVEACRKRLRTIRANHKAKIQTGEQLDVIPTTSNGTVQADAGVSQNRGFIEVRAIGEPAPAARIGWQEALQEAGIT